MGTRCTSTCSIKKADWSQGERQEQLKRSYWAMVCSIPIPTPTELEDFATKLYDGVWLEIEGYTPDKAVPFMKCVKELMPRGNREVEAFCGNMGFQALFNS